MKNRHVRVLVLGAALAIPGATSGCTTPAALTQMNDQLNQAADAVNDIRVDLSVLYDTIDSLRIVVAKQDTTIARLANATGVQIVK